MPKRRVRSGSSRFAVVPDLFAACAAPTSLVWVYYSSSSVPTVAVGRPLSDQLLKPPSIELTFV